MLVRRIAGAFAWGLVACTRPSPPDSTAPRGRISLDLDEAQRLVRPRRLDLPRRTRPAQPLSCPALRDDLDSVRVVVDSAVLFELDSANLRDEAQAVLRDLVASQVTPFPRVRLVVEGHTDDQGSDAYNAKLSRRRADAVAGWLTGHGVAKDRVQSKGYGETKPVADNATETGRAANRRVELLVQGVSEGGQCGPARACCVLDVPVEDCRGADLGRSAWTDEPSAAGVYVDDRVARLCRTPRAGQSVWITSTGEDKIAKLDAATGREQLRVPTWGEFPQRTAVSEDGSVWVTNRNSGSYVHLADDGDVQCASAYDTCLTRAAAVDPDGHAWIGCHDEKSVRRIDATRTDGEVMLVDEPRGGHRVAPRCLETAEIDLKETAPYGLAADADGGLWVTSNLGTTIARIDTIHATRMAEFDVKHDVGMRRAGGCFSPYGITIDLDGNPWFGNHLCGTVLKMDGRTGRILGSFGGGQGRRLKRPRALGIDRDGNVWVAENEGTDVVKLSPRGGFLRRVDLRPCGGDDPGALGTGADAYGHMWTVLQNAGKVMRYTTDGEILGCYPDDPKTPPLREPYTYSDLTGSLLSLVTRETGRVRARVSAGARTQWRMLTLRVSTPPGSTVCVRARAADDPMALDDAPWSGQACPQGRALEPRRVRLGREQRPGPIGELLEVELTLRPGPDAALPVVADLSAAGIAAD